MRVNLKTMPMIFLFLTVCSSQHLLIKNNINWFESEIWNTFIK